MNIVINDWFEYNLVDAYELIKNLILTQEVTFYFFHSYSRVDGRTSVKRIKFVKLRAFLNLCHIY